MKTEKNQKQKYRPEDLEVYLDIEEQNAQHGFAKGAIKKLVRILFSHPALLWSALVLTLVATAATILEPWLFGYTIDHAVVPKDRSALKELGLIFVTIMSVRVLALGAQSYLFQVLGQRIVYELRMKVFSRLQQLPMTRFDRIPAGKLVTRVTNDVSTLADSFSNGFVTIISNLLIVSGILLGLIVLNPRLGLIASAAFPVMILLATYFSQRLKKAYRNARSKLSAVNAFLAENLNGMRTVQLFAKQGDRLGRFNVLNQWYADAQFGSVRVFALFQPTITVTAGVSMGLVIWFGGRMVQDGALQVGTLVSYFAYVLSLFQPMRELADKWNVFLSGLASAERIFAILDWNAEKDLKSLEEPARTGRLLKGKIVFENVWFAYDDENWVLKDFSCVIEPGMKVGVVGPTGSGKTTFISLLMRFYEPQHGRILLDGVDLREYEKRELRSAVAFIQQDVFTFSGSIRENVTLWDRESTKLEEKMSGNSTLKKLSSLEQGLDTEIQERGSNLSLGQKQVISFARAAWINPSIWILDEATANVDSETEKDLELLLRDASKGQTSIIIAHRLSTIQNADLILVLNRGRLVESGRHDDLVKFDGLYARLFRYQRSWTYRPSSEL